MDRRGVNSSIIGAIASGFSNHILDELHGDVLGDGRGREAGGGEASGEEVASSYTAFKQDMS